VHRRLRDRVAAPAGDRQADVSGGANASIVATSARSDGKPQVTYNGHPLYLFSADQKAGDTNGQGVNAFGGLWYVLSSSVTRSPRPAAPVGVLAIRTSREIRHEQRTRRGER
jgi:hypothetical protein